MAYGTIRADFIEGTSVTIDLSTAGQYDFAGDLIPDADSTRDLGSTSLQWSTLYVDTIDAFSAGGNIIPSTDSTFSLGSNTVRWQNIYSDDVTATTVTATDVYTGDLHLKNDRGDWTMIEDEEFMTLRNNKTGKVYKLLMEEVEG